jgi:RNA polymerase sigma factor (sigma-70 family)
MMATEPIGDRSADLPCRRDQPASRSSSGLLGELARRPPLTSEQECALGWRIRGVDARVPPPGESRPSPQAARNRLVEQNVRLVMAIAREYRNRGVATEDLIQEGLLSLHRAAEKFDPARGFRFGTYATCWVRRAMGRACLESAAPVRMPEELATRARQALDAAAKLRERLGREPSAEETAAAVEMRADQLLDVWCAMRPPASLDASVDPSGQVLGETLPDPGPTPEQEVLARTEWAELSRLIDELPRPEREVVRLRLGLDPERSGHRVEGRAMGASRQRVYKVAIRALRRLHQAYMARRPRVPGHTVPSTTPIYTQPAGADLAERLSSSRIRAVAAPTAPTGASASSRPAGRSTTWPAFDHIGTPSNKLNAAASPRHTVLAS